MEDHMQHDVIMLRGLVLALGDANRFHGIVVARVRDAVLAHRIRAATALHDEIAADLVRTLADFGTCAPDPDYSRMAMQHARYLRWGHAGDDGDLRHARRAEACEERLRRSMTLVGREIVNEVLRLAIACRLQQVERVRDGLRRARIAIATGEAPDDQVRLVQHAVAPGRSVDRLAERREWARSRLPLAGG
jgi:hypothetical protein